MNKKIIILFIIVCSVASAIFFAHKSYNSQIIVDFYDINFLRNSKAVEKVLKNLGFFEADLKTDDNLMINTIILDQSKIHQVAATIISCPGFVPGNKEGMTTLHAMFADQPYNFMFIDSRGHGKSDGQLLTYQGIKNYGQSEYLDIIAAIKYIAQYNKEHNICPNIIIHGLCSGAYHSIKAVIEIKKSDPEIYHQIKGIILDSAWSCIPDIIGTIIAAESAERCKRYHISFLQPCVAYVLQTLYDNCFQPTHCQQIPIVKIISEVDQPILFIHAQDDLFVPINHVHPLIAQTKQPTSWFVENSSHVNNHIDYKDEYREHMQKFIKSVL